MMGEAGAIKTPLFLLVDKNVVLDLLLRQDLSVKDDFLKAASNGGVEVRFG
jgi:hypothetical protein